MKFHPLEIFKTGAVLESVSASVMTSGLEVCVSVFVSVSVSGGVCECV